jgi:hypothetical protein
LGFLEISGMYFQLLLQYFPQSIADPELPWLLVSYNPWGVGIGSDGL